MADSEQAPSQAEKELHERQLKRLVRTLFAFALFGQLLAFWACIYVWVNAGASLLALGVGLAAAAAIVAFVDIQFLRRVVRAVPRMSPAVLDCMWWAGFVSLAVAGWVGISLVFGFSRHVARAAMLALIVLLVAGLIYDAVRERMEKTWFEHPERHVPASVWWLRGLGLVGGPVLAGWLAASASLWLIRDDTDTVRAWLTANQPAKRECLRWTVNGEPLRVIVTLSGGGYRAATMHAGVLAAFDDRCVPVEVLSTVSGGSIIGATYALGVPPREFAARLISRKPGLTDMRLSLFKIHKSTAELFREHLRSTYFGERGVAELREPPLLLVNTTDYRNERTHLARVALFRGALSRLKVSNLPIADVVAASGAYPGAFEPIEIAAEGIDAAGHAYLRGFMLDGGIVENLGVEGVRIFSKAFGWTESARDRPVLLVVSDASGYAGSGQRLVVNPSAEEALLRANDIQFDTLHRLLFAELTGFDDLPTQIRRRPAWEQYYIAEFPKRWLSTAWRPSGGGITIITPKARENKQQVRPQRLATVVLPLTARETGDLLDRYSHCVAPSGEKASQVQERTAKLNTLEELEPKAAADAFWLGYAIGEIYGHAIECARAELAGQACTQAPDTAISCPRKLGALLPTLKNSPY